MMSAGNLLLTEDVSPHSNFNHVSNGNYESTQKAIEAYLNSKGMRPQSHMAELVMFMERSFSGKYRKNIRSHYQQIMPSETWRKGDSLSEKLTRCKDKETFKRRFDQIGTTAILKRGNFENYQIKNCDFDGRPYLRLIDTVCNNISRFYRNDTVADSLIQLAIGFYRKNQKNKADSRKSEGVLSGKPEGKEMRKPEVIRLENPNPLLTRVSIKKKTDEPDANSLTLIASSFSGKDKNQPPNKISEKGKFYARNLPDKQDSEISTIELPDASCFEQGNDIEDSVPINGFDIFQLWRQSVLAENDVIVSRSPSKKQIDQSSKIANKFTEFFPANSILEYFQILVKNWLVVRRALKNMGVWQSIGQYPEIHDLLVYSDKLLTWYKQQKMNSIQSSITIQTEEEKPLAEIGKPTKNVIEVPLRGCIIKTEKGRSFRGREQESYEYQIASLESSIHDYDHRMAEACREGLVKLSIDLEASEARIKQLREMSREDFEKYCC